MHGASHAHEACLDADACTESSRSNHALAHWHAGVAIPVQKFRKPPAEKVYLFLHITYNPSTYIFAFFT